MENTTIWKQIQQGLRETERLIGRKEYNMAMIKARQTLEFMVRCMAEKACVVEGDLSDTIDQLYEGRWISRTTKDHYHNIRITCSLTVSEKSTFNSVCTCHNTKLTCSYCTSSVIVCMEAYNKAVSVLYISAYIFHLVCIYIRCSHFNSIWQI